MVVAGLGDVLDHRLQWSQAGATAEEQDGFGPRRAE